MLASSALLPLIVAGLVAGSNNGWKSDTQYVYRVSGRTLTSLNTISDVYTGVIYDALFNVQTKNEDGSSLIGRVSDARYGKVSAELPYGGNADIDGIDYRPLPLTDKPFEIKMQKGVVKDLIVEKGVPIWEANILKSIVSQIQIDTQGENIIDSDINQLPKDGKNSAVYKTMEDTVTGKYETLYEINPLPEYVVQMKPYLVPFEKIKGDGQTIELIKTKNYSNTEQLTSYYYGLGDMTAMPFGNKLGELMSRNSLSHVILTGNLQRYTIQYSVTTEKITASPTAVGNNKKGTVLSTVNLTLVDMQQADKRQMVAPANPISLGDLVYTYNHPFSHSKRSRVSELKQPPESPLLPYFVGYMGKSIKGVDNMNLVKRARDIAIEIGREMQNPEYIPSGHTLSKYVTLSSLVRIMNEKEIEQVGESLYKNSNKEEGGGDGGEGGGDGGDDDAWKGFRDAVAESGTGPALLVVKNWILEGKMSGENAAEMISATAQSVRYPTETYIEEFYDFVVRPEVRSHDKLNVTAIIRFSELVNHVYVNRRYSHNEYPAHGFDTLVDHKFGENFVKSKYIPYLTEQLRVAVSEGDSHKVQVYVSAIGYVGHPDILKAYKPYLEGDQKVSRFQRLHMVNSFEELVRNFPDVARSVLFKIYSNAAETPDVRVAALYQLIRTRPPAVMLQRIAEYTNIDPSEDVNSAVKSLIEEASLLNSPEYAEKSSDARSAKPFLNGREYGHRYSHGTKKVTGRFEKETFQSIGSPDSYLPKAFRFAYRSEFAGYSKQYSSIQSAVSSVTGLYNAFVEQILEYVLYKEQQRRNHDESAKYKWSSGNIVRMLNIQVEQLEQPEGNLLIKIGGLKRMYTVDNKTLEALPKAIEEIYDCLRAGKRFKYTKFYKRDEIAIAYPTETAFPFLYTYDIPTVISFGGNISFVSEPALSTGTKLRMPEKFEMIGHLEFLLSSAIKGQLGFITPFDHQHYVSGYEQNSQVYLPIYHDLRLNVKKKEVQLMAGIENPARNTTLVYHESLPYVSVQDILDLQPIAENPDTTFVGPPPDRYYDYLGQRYTGMTFFFDYAAEQKFLDYRWLYDQIMDRTNPLTLWEAQDMGYKRVELRYAGEISTNKQLKAGIKCSITNHGQRVTENQEEDESKLYRAAENAQERLVEFSAKASAGVNSSKSVALDGYLVFEGDKPVLHRATFAYCRSKVDDMSKLLLYYYRKSKHPDVSPYHFTASIKNHSPNYFEMDTETAFESDISATVQTDFSFGTDVQYPTTVKGQLRYGRPIRSIMYLLNDPRYEKCVQQIRDGNKELHPCTEIARIAKKPTQLSLRYNYENMQAEVYNLTSKVYAWLHHHYFYNADENYANGGHGQKGQVDLDVLFHPVFTAADVYVRTENYSAEYKNIKLHNADDYNPFDYRSYLYNKIPIFEDYTQSCVVDRTAVATFDNLTYPAKLTTDYTVMMVYTPRQAGHQPYSKQSLPDYIGDYNEYAVLVRQAGQKGKEIKVYLRTYETDHKYVVIDMKPGNLVYYNGDRLNFTKNEVNYYNGLYVQLYAEPKTNYLVLDIQNEFKILYDSERVKLGLYNQRYFDSVRGICGNANGMEADDYRAPEDCALRYPNEFIDSYTMPEVAAPKQKHYISGCYNYEYLYANVIPDYDRSGNGSDLPDDTVCTRYQTRYVLHGDHVCFTIRPLPVCRPSCNPIKTISKQIPAHCVKMTAISHLWTMQIDKGGSPDFGLKAPNGNVRFDVPQACQLRHS